MKFIRSNRAPSDVHSAREACYLVNDNWDDFGFKTSFTAILFDGVGVRHALGDVKILSRGLTSGRVNVPDAFSQLDDDWCSLGTSRDYYLLLSKIDQTTRTIYLNAIRDCVFNTVIWQAFRDEEGMQTSLLRGVSAYDVEMNFPRILRGDSKLTSYEFIYDFTASADMTTEQCGFSVQPESKPPTNVHVLIGRNGVGKTRLLAGMADALTENKYTSIGIPGVFVFIEPGNEFLNLVVVSYSAFDRFDPITIGRRKSKTSVPYYYIGIKSQKSSSKSGDTAGVVSLKTTEEFTDEFNSCLNVLGEHVHKKDRSKSAKWDRWMSAIEVLRSDPGIAEFADEFFGDEDFVDFEKHSERFASLSSGHKIVLLTVARLVEYVSDRSLVLIDEPETHLHPPLLGSFIRAISELLSSQNAVAIVATHSPVVLQEVPARCVSFISRSGERIRVRAPPIETFAENVSTLTRKVFGLEVTQSGFYRLLKDSANGRDFSEVLKEFDEQIGAEGRALARAFTTEGEE